MIPYAVSFSKKSEGEFLRLPKEMQKRIAGKLVTSQANPFRFFIRLKGRTDYKLRVGDYRVLADIKQTERIIEITKMGHRRDVYKQA